MTSQECVLKLCEKYTGREIAQMLNVVEGSIYHWKSGRFKPSQENQKKIESLLLKK